MVWFWYELERWAIRTILQIDNWRENWESDGYLRQVNKQHPQSIGFHFCESVPFLIFFPPRSIFCFPKTYQTGNQSLFDFRAKTEINKNQSENKSNCWKIRRKFNLTYLKYHQNVHSVYGYYMEHSLLFQLQKPTRIGSLLSYLVFCGFVSFYWDFIDVDVPHFLHFENGNHFFNIFYIYWGSPLSRWSLQRKVGVRFLQKKPHNIFMK